MGDAMHHRGPDDTRIMVWENVGFIFKRLSIVDLSGGAQPLETADGTVCAMVNGAIYNHREIRARLAHRDALRTQSDCEVTDRRRSTSMAIARSSRTACSCA